MKHKKLFAILTLVCFMFTLMPVAAMAEENALQTAIENGETNITLAAGTFTMPSSTTSASITITGVEGTTIDVTNGAYLDNATLTFENVAFKVGTGYVYGANGVQGSDYAALYSPNVTYKNCTFSGPMRVGRDGAQFINCTFKDLGNDYIWTYGNDVTFDGCTFNTAGKAILIYSDGGNEVSTVSVKNCTFNATAGAKAGAIANQNCAAIEIHNYGNGVDLTTTDNTYNSNFSGEWRIKTYETNKPDVIVNEVEYTTIAIDGKTMTIDADKNVTVLEPVATVGGTPYATLQDALNVAAAGSGNVTVEILKDIDLTNVDWDPVTVSAPSYPCVTVNGNEHTITGLNDMLFDATWAGDSGLIINDLTIKDSNIVHDENDTQGNVGVGAFIGYPQASETITLNNCHLVDSKVEGGHWTGGLIGMAGGYNGNDGPVFMNLTIKDCSVTGSTITGKGSVGGVIGHGSCAAWTQVVITNTEVKGNNITSTGTSNVKAGTVMGTIGAAGQPTTAAGEEKTGGATISVTETGNTVTSNGTTITTVYGRQGTETGMLIITGGTYDNNPIEEDVEYAKPAEGYAIVENEDGTYGVKKAVTGVALSPETATVEIGKTVTLTATVTPEDAYNKNATWSSNNESVATVVDGVVTGVTTGSAIITVTTEDGDYTDTCTVTVIEPAVVPVASVTLDKTTAEIKVDETVTLTATVAPENATNKTVTWISSDETIATVADGVVTALKAGNVTITVTADGKSATCEVTVKAKSSGYYGGGYVSSASVSIASDDNATVKVSDKYADKGETVTITVDAKDGYYAKNVVVTDKNGEAITVTRVALDKWEFTMPSGKVKVDVDTAEYSNEVVLQIGDLDIAVNDAVIQSDVAPFIKNDRTMVPISVIVYALGGTTDWDGETRTVTVTLDGKVLTMVIDEIIPGFGAAAIIVDSRTYVPIGYVADVLGCDVDWIAATRQVVIVK